ncbi:MAG: type II toxin-antitoxin system prevent-host-death family antitoxin [Xanthobacteraceae bacterium]
MKNPNVWKLQDAKARLSEVVRQARAGAPQRITVHGKEAAVLFDPDRFEVSRKPRPARTMAEFVERSKKYRGGAEGITLDRRTGTHMRDKRREIFDGDYSDED